MIELANVSIKCKPFVSLMHLVVVQDLVAELISFHEIKLRFI